ncbi:MAG TPA: iron ABC transporter permease [Anaerolineaceae bacterium]|nr:iron ABC transporter permease [Anaerolineaceae bacterium]
MTKAGGQLRIGDRSSRQAALLWAAPLLFLLVFFFLPLGAIFRQGFLAAEVEGLDPASLSRVIRPLGFTVFQAALSTLLTLLVGLPAAYVFAHFRFPGKELLRTLTAIPFILPTVVAAASFNALLGPRGLVNVALMNLLGLSDPPIQFLNTLGAILAAHVFYNATIVIRNVGGAWERLDPRLEQAAQVLGANGPRTLWEITLPLLRPAILSASLLVFLFDFTSFGVVLLLGGPRFATLEVEIFIQALQMLNLPLAGMLSLVQLLCTLVITGCYSWLNRRAAAPASARAHYPIQRAPKSWLQRMAVAGMVGTLLVLLVSPLSALAVRSVTRLDANRGERGETQTGVTLEYYQELFINRRGSLFYVPPIAAARNSLAYAGATVILSLGLGFPAATALTKPARINNWLDALLLLPLGTSAVTLGLGFILVFNRQPLDLRTFPLLLPIAHTLVALPFVVRTLQPALGSIPTELREAAAVLGAGPLRVWREIDLPIIARAAVASATFAFTISLGEFGATTFLARPEYPTLPIAIYRFLSQPGALNYGQAMAMATLLMVVCGAGILMIERLRLPGEGDF